MSKERFFQQLVPIEEDPLWFGKYAKDLSKEISNNMWGIPVPISVLSEVNTADLVSFFQRVIDNRAAQIRKHGKQGMFFYVWTDDETGELRLNCISDFHKKLPFSGEIERTDDLSAVIDEYLMIARAVASEEVAESSEDAGEEPNEYDEIEDLDMENGEELEEKLLVFVIRLG